MARRKVFVDPTIEQYETKIRELEAELERQRGLNAGALMLQARAEKAEKERDDWRECAESMQQERDSVKARVAELEGELLTVAGLKPVSKRREAAWKAWVEEHPAREREAEP